MIFANGDKVTWHWVPRGGYGREVPVPAIVIGGGPQRVRIKTTMRDRNSDSWKWVERSVKAKHLTLRQMPSGDLGEI